MVTETATANITEEIVLNALRAVKDPDLHKDIVALNMINLAGAPYVASRPTSEKSIMQRIAVGISDRVNALTSKNVLVVDLMCDARLYQPSNYASDGFHPGDGGYAVFAEDTYPALANGTGSQPNTSCPQRRLFP